MTSPIRTIFPRQLDRPSYFARLVVCIAAVALVYYWHGITDDIANIAMLLIWIYAAFFVILPRARDCGMPFIWAILALVPLFFPFLAVALIFRSQEQQFLKAGAQETLPRPKS